MVSETQQILKELKEIRSEIQTIKEEMPNKDMFLTAEEEQLLAESYGNEKNGSLISSEALRRELGI